MRRIIAAPTGRLPLRFGRAFGLAAMLALAAPGISMVWPPTPAAAESARENEVREIARALADDLSQAQRWKPSAEQIAAIAATPEDAAALAAYVEALYASLPPGKPAAKPGQTEILVTGPDRTELPGGYRQAMAHFRPGLEIHGFKYVEPGKDSGMAYDGLFALDSGWVFIPKAWRAFR